MKVKMQTQVPAPVTVRFGTRRFAAQFSGDLGTFGTGGAAYDLTFELYLDGNALTGAVTTRARTSDNPVPRLSYWVELKKAR